MKIKYEIELLPFAVPWFVIPVTKPGLRQDGFTNAGKIPLENIPKEALEQLCEEFKKSVLEKAGY